MFNNKKKYKVSSIVNDDSEIDYNYLERKKILKIKFNKIDTRKYNLINHLSKLLNEYTKVLSKINPEYVLIVGDRYEAFAMSIVCNFLNIKIIHIAGGDITEGAYDEEMRSFISKSSFIHFVTNNHSKKNLIHFVKDKKKLFNYGSPSLDYIKGIKNINKKDISKNLNINFNKYNLLVTFHPETKNLKSTFNNLKILLDSLTLLGSSYNFFFTGSNVDTYGEMFNKKIKKLVKKKNNFYYFSNLGTTKYIQLAYNCDMVIGNSSSIVYEIPFMGIRSLLIGSRQDGRYMSKKVIKIKVNKKTILTNIKKNIKKKKPKKDLKTFGNGNASIKIFKKVDSLINEK